MCTNIRVSQFLGLQAGTIVQVERREFRAIELVHTSTLYSKPVAVTTRHGEKKERKNIVAVCYLMHESHVVTFFYSAEQHLSSGVKRLSWKI